MKKLQISFPRAQIEEFCKRWKIIEFSFFGSVLRDDFHLTSDIDVLVKFSSNSSWGLLDHAKMEEELSQIFNRPVDLVNKKAVENSHNWIRKQNILESAEVYYAA
ncbi:MAG: nucleotidyltransferase family protein [Verrucomicrobiota bacterium]|nr:nucleotidyltransferase family protein [Verrucomicrobiota bacterium]